MTFVTAKDADPDKKGVPYPGLHCLLMSHNLKTYSSTRAPNYKQDCLSRLNVVCCVSSAGPFKTSLQSDQGPHCLSVCRN